MGSKKRFYTAKAKYGRKLFTTHKQGGYGDGLVISVLKTLRLHHSYSTLSHTTPPELPVWADY